MSSPIDPKAFEKLRRIAPHQLAARRAPQDWQARPVPEEIGFKLTNRCDLRCSHCFQWGDDGYHKRLPTVERGRDLSIAVVEKVLEATRERASNVFLWGGEPLVYRDWDRLVELLAAHRRWTTICTNGTLIERRLPSLFALGARLEVSVSIDGFEREHDALRGDGAFARTMAGVRALVAAKASGDFTGEISVNCVISDALVPRLCELVQLVQDQGVEALYLSFPWYISRDTASAMDVYVAAHLADLVENGTSWHAFTFHLDPARLAELRAELARVRSAPWKLKLRYNPALDDEDLAAFIAGSGVPAQGKTRCLAVRTRLDVFPNADVVSCKFYPELVVGNLTDASVEDVWLGAAYDRVRRTVATCGLMPACAKCNLLYTRGA